MFQIKPAKFNDVCKIIYFMTPCHNFRLFFMSFCMKNVISTWIQFIAVKDLWLGRVKGYLNMTNTLLLQKMTLHGCTWLHIPWTSSTVQIFRFLHSALVDNFVCFTTQHWKCEKLCPHVCPPCIYKHNLSYTCTHGSQGSWGPVIMVANYMDLHTQSSEQEGAASHVEFRYCVVFCLIHGTTPSCRTYIHAMLLEAHLPTDPAAHV